MKISTNKGIIISIVTFIIISLAACSAGIEDIPSLTPDKTTTAHATTAEQFSLKVTLIDNEGYNITSKNVLNDISLFVFDQSNKFHSQINIDSQSIIERRDIKITCPEADQITVIAWGGIAGDRETINHLTKGSSSINDLMLSLKQEKGIANPAGDLFYGQLLISKTIHSQNAITSNELVMERKTASISLSTSGIIPSNSDIYSYKIKNVKTAFNYNGELTGETIEYIIPASFNEKGNLITNALSIFPSPEITIELYRNDKLVFSAHKDHSARNLSAKSGKLLDISFDYHTTLYVETMILPWGAVSQDVMI